MSLKETTLLQPFYFFFSVFPTYLYFIVNFVFHNFVIYITDV